MAASTLIGYGAAILGTVCWLPQVLRTLRTREVRDLSLWTNVMILGTVTLWLIYGLMLGDRPIIVANSFSILCVGTIVLAKLLWGRG